MPVDQQISAAVWGLAVGAGILVAIWAVIRGGWVGRTEAADTPVVSDVSKEPIQPHSHENLKKTEMAHGGLPMIHEYPEGISEAHNPMPLIIKLTIVSVLVWTVVYVVLFAQSGFNFS